MSRPLPEWLKTAVFYEIYPQSFYDSNGDGIGDFQGIIEKLDYIRSLGCNALWINPCFDSPFKDAGYDVRDYMKTAARYCTNEDLYRLFDEAHARGIRVLLDLVPGHTSEEHAWFRESGRAAPNEYSGRYIWTDYWIRGIAGYPYIGGECERNGVYMLNFFKCQPALNYGFLNPKENWQNGTEDAAPLATREAVKDIMRFWLSHGCDGFRVDMAASLVKNDDEAKSGTCRVWRDLLTVLEDYPEAAVVAEWNDQERAICSAGFDMDFYLDWPGNGYNSLMRDYESRQDGEDHSYFRKDGKGDIGRFLADYLPKYEASRGSGYVSMLTCNHDTPRPSYRLDMRELKLAYAFLLTMPGVPFIYYGDEIGMRYLAGLPTKEGGYTRTGSRTPMQWDKSPNLGFSKGLSADLYLPVDTAEDAPTVEAQEQDPESLLNLVRRLTALRTQEEDLQADTPFEVLYDENGGRPFVYRRGQIVIAVNPAGREVALPLSMLTEKLRAAAGTSSETSYCFGESRILLQIGEGSVRQGQLRLGAQSFMVLGKKCFGKE